MQIRADFPVIPWVVSEPNYMKSVNTIYSVVNMATNQDWTNGFSLH